MILSSISCVFVGHLYVFFGEIICLDLPSIFYSIVCVSGMELPELPYILEINPLSTGSFAIIFSHSEGCLFILFIVSFAVQIS